MPLTWCLTMSCERKGRWEGNLCELSNSAMPQYTSCRAHLHSHLTSLVDCVLLTAARDFAVCLLLVEELSGLRHGCADDLGAGGRETRDDVSRGGRGEEALREGRGRRTLSCKEPPEDPPPLPPPPMKDLMAPRLSHRECIQSASPFTSLLRAAPAVNSRSSATDLVRVRLTTTHNLLSSLEKLILIDVAVLVGARVLEVLGG